MKTWIFICMSIAMLLWFLSTLRRKPSQKKGCIDAIIPAYNEGPCLAQSLNNLLRNPYFCRVICVNDGSTDNTEAVMAEVKRKWGDRFVAVTQKNTGKGGALMNGLNYATCDQVFLSDADTYVPPDQDGMGYMLAEIERGAVTAHPRDRKVADDCYEAHATAAPGRRTVYYQRCLRNVPY